ncbi:tRNA lysidine(34) synthetase TilS [Legionella fallonii]|uniref:tRNA lysidine(34) synthetase TilS n=1 Tax=Legionella fallonii TaxID=96230 RepID=UPI0005D3B2E1|nr:tRNA lysidine(34) synthetase TilS [Legionella fallonii]
MLTSEWIERLGQFTKLIVGFSGGLDSTVLLHVLSSHTLLRHRLTAIHIHHGISVNAEYWQRHCEQFCRNLNIPFFARTVQFDRSANIEEGARVARYAVFTSLLSANDCLLLGHHMDDQAETVLLQLFRGAGVDGLAAMTECGELGLGTMARPFLAYTRTHLEEYAKSHGLEWIDDESNQEIKYSRNYLRHEIMPLLMKKWPGVIGNIARTAAHCQQAKANLDALAEYDSQGIALANNSLSITPLKKLSFERVTNILRVWLKKNQVQMPSTLTFQRLIHEVIFANSDASPEVSWENIIVRRYQQCLYINQRELESHPKNTRFSRDEPCNKSIIWSDFPQPLLLAELNICLIAKQTKQGLVIPERANIIVQFRQGGEQIRLHGQTKQLKKLFQEWAVPPWQRDTIPLIYINDQLAVVVGYAVSDAFYSKSAAHAWELLTKG